MKKFSVIFEESARDDLQKSFEWGCKHWGISQASKWVRELRSATYSQLENVPKALAIAPENEAFEDEIRQLIVGRYRILFIIRGKKVHVLHIRGAFNRGD